MNCMSGATSIDAAPTSSNVVFWNLPPTTFFAACSDHGTVICLHIGSSSDMVVTAMDAPVTVQMSLQPLSSSEGDDEAGDWED